MIMPEWWCAPAVWAGWHNTLALPVHGVARGSIRFTAQQPVPAPAKPSARVGRGYLPTLASAVTEDTPCNGLAHHR
ncbi:MAG: hypothetical protein ING52_10845 [Burkholderiales bacterium]|jgi:hypothetical protein|nr:hypothetical protein [Burkholderiales bacterium]